jgi:hypothetical protein
MRDLLDYKPLLSAQVLGAFARGYVSNPQLKLYLKDEFKETEPKNVMGLGVNSLNGVTDDDAKVLNEIGVKTIGNLEQLGNVSNAALMPHLDNGFFERPSAPPQLLPGLSGSVVSTTRYTSFIRDTEFRALTLKINKDCVVPLPITGQPTFNKDADAPLTSWWERWIERMGPKNPKSQPPIETEQPKIISLSDIFTDQKCPVIHLGYMCDHHQRWINPLCQDRIGHSSPII